MTTYSFIQYDVLNDLVYFKGTPTPGLVDILNENKDDLSSIKAIIQNDTTGQLNLLSSDAAQEIKDFLIATPEIDLADSKSVILTIAIIDNTTIGNIDIVSKNLDSTKTYITKSGATLAINIDILKPSVKWKTMGKCRNCLKFTFDEDNDFNFTGNIGGSWDGTFRNGQKVYDVNIPTFATPQSFGVYTNYKMFWKPNVTYTGSIDYNGNPINIVNKHKWICVPSSSIGTVNEIGINTFFHVLNDFSASCPYAPPTNTWYNFFGKPGYFLLENTSLPTLQTNLQQNGPCPQFSPTPGDVDWGYNCGPNGCVAAPSGSIGTYATLNECTASCAINYGWNCTSLGCVTGSAANPGLYATLEECQSSCIPDYGWNCTVPGGCIPGTEENPGQYDTLAQCEIACPASYGYNCVNGNCIPGTANNTGSYATIVECAATCSATYGYNCTPNGCVLGDVTNTGSYDTLQDCEDACFYPTPEPTYCGECIGNLVTNGDFLNGPTGWISQPSTYTPGVGILSIDTLTGIATAGVSTNFNNNNTSSISLTQANVFNISCSYNVCFQAWTGVNQANVANATVAIDDGNYPIINLVNNLTTTPTAYTVTLNNVATNNLTFYFGFPSGSTGNNNAEINIDNICVTLLSCPPEEIGDCLITGSTYNYETVTYDCLCPEGYISNGSGSCIVFASSSISASSYPTSSLINPTVFFEYKGESVLQNSNSYPITNGSYIPPNVGWSQPSLYYYYDINGHSSASLTSPSPLTGNPNVHHTQYTFDVLKAPFWTDPPPAGNPTLANNNQVVGGISNPPSPIPTNVWSRWLIKRLRYFKGENPNLGNWLGVGTIINTPATKTYYVMVCAGDEWKIKLNGTTILKTNPSIPNVLVYSNNSYPEYIKQVYARTPSTPTSGLGTLPAPFFGFNPYITNYISGSWGWDFWNVNYNIYATFPWTTQFSYSNGYSNVSIYPVIIPSGSCNKINIEARGAHDGKSGFLGAAIFDNTATQIANANLITDLKVVWDTLDLPNIASSALVPRYLYEYSPNSEPSPGAYAATCPSGSTPVGGNPCNGCLTTGSSIVSTIPCGQCIECTHGKLYNGYVVDKGGYMLQGRGPGGIINTGSMNAATWVIPAESDWDTLITYLNNGTAPPSTIGSLGTIAGGKMKDYTRDLNATCWQNPNIGAQTPTGSSEWAGTAGGKRDSNGTFSGLGFEGIWWSANSSSAFPNPFKLYARELKHFSNDVYRSIYDKNSGLSLRLVRPAVAGETNGSVIVGDYIGKDGTTYDSIVIGTQVWINKNLSETQYNDGTTVSITTNPTAWSNAINSPVTASSCYYDNDSNNSVIPTGNINPATGLCYDYPDYYVYQKCGTSQYLVQTVSGSTTMVGKVQKDSNLDCWEFVDSVIGIPNYANQINYTGNYFSGSNHVYDNCDECNAIHTIYMKFGTKNC